MTAPTLLNAALMSLLILLLGCPPATTGADDDDAATDDDDDVAPLPCEVPDVPLELDADDDAVGSLGAGERAWYAFEAEANIGLFVGVFDNIGDSETEGDAPMLRVCTPDGEVYVWAEGTPLWWYATAHSSRLSAVIREAGTWGIEVVAPADRDLEFELRVSWGADSPGTSTEANPNEREFEPQSPRWFTSTFDEPGRDAWYHFWSDCSNCQIAIVGGMGLDGSDATATFTVYDSAGNELDSREDPARSSGGAEFHEGGGGIPPGQSEGLTVRVSNANGESGPSHWVPFFVWIYEGQN